VKRLSLLLVLAVILLAAPAALAQATYAGLCTPATSSNNSPFGTITLTCSLPAGDYFVLDYTSTTGTTPYCQDNNLHTLFMGPYLIPTLTGAVTWSFGYVVPAGGATSITCTYTGAHTSINGVYYSGSSGFNFAMANGTASGTGTAASITPTLDDANDTAVCAFTDSSTTFTTPYTGTDRQNEATQPTQAMVDKTAASAGAVTVAATLSSSAPWQVPCIELRTVAPTQTFSLIQLTSSGYGGLSGPATCPYNGNICTWQMATGVAGHWAGVLLLDHSDSVSLTQRTILTAYLCSVSTGCNSGNALDTLTCPGSAVQGYVGNSLGTQSVDGCYTDSLAGGETYATLTRSGNNGTEREEGCLAEVSVSSGTISLDALAEAADGSSSSTHSIPAVTITGSNDFIFYGYSGPSGPDTVTSPLNNFVLYAHFGCAISLNVSSGATPTWVSNQANNAAANAMAFLGSVGGPTQTIHTAGVKMTAGVKVTP